MDLSETPSVVVRRHPWEIARHGFFRRLLLSQSLNRQPLKVLDIGSGDGWLANNLLPSLHPQTWITCWDSAYTKDWLSNSGEPRIRYMVERPSGRFELVLLLDVLEHIEDDETFLGEVVAELVADNGYVVVSVPAWKALFGSHDLRLNHVRRYQPQEAKRLLHISGLEIVEYGGLFGSLLFPRIIGNIASRMGLQGSPRTAGDWNAGLFISIVLEKVLLFDARLSLLAGHVGLSIPGLSWWALCRKR